MKAQASWEQAEKLWLAALVLLGAWPRFAGLGVHSLWYDEVITAATAQAPWRDFFSMVRDWFLCPPLDYLMMRPFMALGHGDAMARAWSAMAGTLCIPAIYLWARDVAGRRTALIAALILASSAFAVTYAQEARMYSSFLLLTILSFHALHRLQEAPGRGRAALYGLLLSALMLTQYFGVWVALLQAPWLISRLKSKLGWGRALGLAAFGWGLGAAVFLLWMPSFLKQLAGSHGTVAWGMPFTFESFSALLKLYSSGKTSAVLFVAVFLFAGVQAHRRGLPQIRALAWIAVGALVLPLLASQLKPNVSARYLIFFLAPYYLVVAAGIDMAIGRSRYGLPLALIVLLAGQVPAMLRDKEHGINAFKPRWREAAERINAAPLAPVAVDEWTNSIVMGYYLRPYENHFWPDLSRPAPPQSYRVQVADEAMVRRMETGAWKGWALLHFGVNRDPSFDPLAQRIRALAGAPRLHLVSPNESNGLDLLYVGRQD